MTILDWNWPGQEWAVHFRFVPGETPLSTLSVVLTNILLYFVVVLGGKWIMSKIIVDKNDPKKGYNVNDMFVVHNILMAIGSFVLLVGMVLMLIPKWQLDGFVHTLCSREMENDRRLTALYYINHVFKHVEFLDTIYLVLGRKRILFLHVYHHAATMLLTWSQLYYYDAVQWVPITLNLIVHVVMYFYYAITALGYKVKWKQWVTNIQIIQFVLDLVFCYICAIELYNGVNGVKILDWKGFKIFGKYPYGCAGHEIGAWFGCAILTSYLVLFLSFYVQTYFRTGKTDKNNESAAQKLKAKKED